MVQRRTLVRAAALGGLLGAGSALTACAPGDAGPQNSGPVELRVAVFTGNEGHLAVLNDIAAGFVAAHPDKVSKVVIDTLPADSYITALQTQIAGGQSPDLAWVFEANARQFVDGGAFVDAASTLRASAGYDLDDVVDEALRVWRTGDQLFAYPFSNSPFGVYVNLDLIDDVDAPHPRDLVKAGDWTWDNLAKSAAAVAQKGDGVTGFQTGTDPFANWLDGLGTIWPQWGAQPWDDAGTRCELTSDSMVDFFTWFHDQIHEAHAHHKPGEQYTFANAQVGYQVGLLSSAKAVSTAGFAWDFLPMPAGPAGVRPIVGQSAIGVLSQSQKTGPALEFLAWSTSRESGAKLAQYFPQPRSSLLTLDVIKTVSPLLTDEMITGTIIDQANHGTTKQGHRNVARIVDKVKVHLDAFWADPAADARSVLSKACTDIQADLT